MFSVRPCHSSCGVVLLLLVFVIFFLFVSWLAFYVLSLGKWLGKRKVNVAQEELCGTEQVMQDIDESQCMSKHSGR